MMFPDLKEKMKQEYQIPVSNDKIADEDKPTDPTRNTSNHNTKPLLDVMGASKVS